MLDFNITSLHMYIINQFNRVFLGVVFSTSTFNILSSAYKDNFIFFPLLFVLGLLLVCGKC